MVQYLYIAAGGAGGALFRHAITQGVHSLLGPGFPYGTLVVNVSGSFLMGTMYVVFMNRIDDNAALHAGLVVGFLAAFTTFSTFSIDTLNLIESGEHIKAGINIFLSVTLCILGCWLGMILGRSL
ncbi:MAG: fluoride efflux transporter CrcB [Thiotrichales bacterium]|nr:fluoride efflux transporter CrcB [Thiotrichales bacterium]